jgi:hypothetical protein
MSTQLQEPHEKLQELHTLTANATIAHLKYQHGVITTEEFIQQIDDLDCHCHSDIVLDKKHIHLDSHYRECLDGILRVYHLENKK